MSFIDPSKTTTPAAPAADVPPPKAKQQALTVHVALPSAETVATRLHTPQNVRHLIESGFAELFTADNEHGEKFRLLLESYNKPTAVMGNANTDQIFAAQKLQTFLSDEGGVYLPLKTVPFPEFYRIFKAIRKKAGLAIADRLKIAKQIAGSAGPQ